MVMIKQAILGFGKLIRNFLVMIGRLTVRLFAIAGILSVVTVGFFALKSIIHIRKQSGNRD